LQHKYLTSKCLSLGHPLCNINVLALTVNVKCCWHLTCHPHLSCKTSPNLSPAWSPQLNSTLPKVLPHMNSTLGSSASCNCLAPGFHLQIHLEVVDFLGAHPAQLLSANTSTITSDDRSLFLKASSTGHLSAATACSLSSNETPCSSAPLRYHNKCLNQLKGLAVGFALYDKSVLTASKPNPLGQAIHFRSFSLFLSSSSSKIFMLVSCVVLASTSLFPN